MHGVTIRVIGQEDIYNHQVKHILTECLEQRGKLPEQNTTMCSQTHTTLILIHIHIHT